MTTARTFHQNLVGQLVEWLDKDNVRTFGTIRALRVEDAELVATMEVALGPARGTFATLPLRWTTVTKEIPDTPARTTTHALAEPAREHVRNALQLVSSGHTEPEGNVVLSRQEHATICDRLRLALAPAEEVRHYAPFPDESPLCGVEGIGGFTLVEDWSRVTCLRCLRKAAAELVDS